MKFVTGTCNKMYGRIAQIKRIMANSLYGVTVKNISIQLAQLSYCIYIEHVANFIVGMHECYQTFLFALCQQLFQMLHVDVPKRLSIDIDIHVD